MGKTIAEKFLECTEFLESIPDKVYTPTSGGSREKLGAPPDKEARPKGERRMSFKNLGSWLAGQIAIATLSAPDWNTAYKQFKDALNKVATEFDAVLSGKDYRPDLGNESLKRFREGLKGVTQPRGDKGSNIDSTAAYLAKGSGQAVDPGQVARAEKMANSMVWVAENTAINKLLSPVAIDKPTAMPFSDREKSAPSPTSRGESEGEFKRQVELRNRYNEIMQNFGNVDEDGRVKPLKDAFEAARKARQDLWNKDFGTTDVYGADVRAGLGGTGVVSDVTDDFGDVAKVVSPYSRETRDRLQHIHQEEYLPAYTEEVAAYQQYINARNEVLAELETAAYREAYKDTYGESPDNVYRVTGRGYQDAEGNEYNKKLRRVDAPKEAETTGPQVVAAKQADTTSSLPDVNSLPILLKRYRTLTQLANQADASGSGDTSFASELSRVASKLRELGHPVDGGQVAPPEEDSGGSMVEQYFRSCFIRRTR